MEANHCRVRIFKQVLVLTKQDERLEVVKPGTNVGGRDHFCLFSFTSLSRLFQLI